MPALEKNVVNEGAAPVAQMQIEPSKSSANRVGNEPDRVVPSIAGPSDENPFGESRGRKRKQVDDDDDDDDYVPEVLSKKRDTSPDVSEPESSHSALPRNRHQQGPILLDWSKGKHIMAGNLTTSSAKKPHLQEAQHKSREEVEYLRTIKTPRNEFQMNGSQTSFNNSMNPANDGVELQPNFTPTVRASNGKSTTPFNQIGQEPPKKPAVKIRYWIIASRHPRATRIKWTDCSLTGQSIWSVFDQVSARTQKRDIQSIEFTLVTSGSDTRVSIKRDQEDFYEEMKKDFSQDIKHDVRTGNTNFEIWMEPDPSVAFAGAIEQNRGVEGNSVDLTFSV